MAGIAYLNTGKYAEALTSLQKFEPKGEMLTALSKGAIGDAYSQQNKPNEALNYYIQAA